MYLVASNFLDPKSTGSRSVYKAHKASGYTDEELASN
jgi:hypothetical protein